MAKYRFLSERQLEHAFQSENAALLAALGQDEQQRIHAVNTIFEAKSATVRGVWFCTLVANAKKGTRPPKPGYLFFRVSRTLAGMPNREREYLRIAELLNVGNNGEYHDIIRWKAALLWGDGQGTLEPGSQKRSPGADNPEQVSRNFLKEWMGTHFNVDHTVAEIQQSEMPRADEATARAEKELAAALQHADANVVQIGPGDRARAAHAEVVAGVRAGAARAGSGTSRPSPRTRSRRRRRRG